jgi:hypothetical protein
MYSDGMPRLLDHEVEPGVERIKAADLSSFG